MRQSQLKELQSSWEAKEASLLSSNDELQVANQELVTQVAELQSQAGQVPALRYQIEGLQDDLARLNHATDTYQETAAANRDIIDSQKADLERWHAADGLTAEIFKKIEEVENSDETEISAREVARDAVIEQLERRITANKANELIDEERRKVRRSYTPERTEAIKHTLRQMMEDDGTFKKVAAEVETDVYNQLTAELQAERHAVVAESISDPEVRAAMVARHRAELEASGELDEYEQNLRHQAQEEWKTAAINELYAAVEALVESDRDEYMARAKQEWLLSDEAVDFLSAKKHAAEQHWQSLSAEQAAQELGDQEWKNLLAAKAERNKGILRRQLANSEAIDAYNNGGLDVAALPEGTRLQLRFGTIVNSDSWSESRGDYEYILRLERTIDVCRMSEHKLVVVQDSLAHSNNPYEQAAALKPAEVVSIGSPAQNDTRQIGLEKIAHGLPVAIKRAGSDSAEIVPGADLKDIVINDKSSARKGKDFTGAEW